MNYSIKNDISIVKSVGTMADKWTFMNDSLNNNKPMR